MGESISEQLDIINTAFRVASPTARQACCSGRI
ncbi:hypothetical protein MLR15_22550 [Escherichia coli]|nr:hypothetical protein [Escherichia coli]MCN8240572.1 hypothetical protein [Escherichia coli]